MSQNDSSHAMIQREITAGIELQREFNRLNSARIEEQYGTYGLYKVEMVAALKAQQGRIAAILATFYRAELSLSSVQPILDLAVELNPDLKPK